jgi:SRSO17 transposase
VAFATKPALAREMIIRALEGGARASRVTADEVYGADPGLREELERREVGSVLAVACSHRVTTAAGALRADAIATRLPDAPGSACQQAPALRARATTTGHGSASPPLTPTAPDSAGC